MGAHPKKKKIKKKILLNLFIVFLIIPLVLEFFPAKYNNDYSLGQRLIDLCFGKIQTNEDYVEFFNVGQGDSTLIKSDGAAVLIDFGVKSDNNKIYTNLLKYGIKSLDLAVITHHHMDHMGDFLNLAEKIKIERLVINNNTAEDGEGEFYQKVIQAAKKNGTEIISPKAGKVFEFGNAKLKILNSCDFSEEENNRSIALMLTICGSKILFTGDGELEFEKLLSQRVNIDCDILKMGHHGSASSSSTQFLKAASPKYAVASCGYDNLYGHPSDWAIERAKEQGAVVLRTDLDRNIRFVFNNKNNTYTVKTERGKVYDNY